MDEQRQEWGVSGGLGFWFSSIVFGPVLLFIGGLCGAALMMLLTIVPLALLGDDPRLSGGFWGWPQISLGDLSGGLAFVGFILGALALFLRWNQRTRTRLILTEEALVCERVLWRRRFRWSEVMRAFVTGTEDAEELTTWTLHLWTPWREISLPIWRVVPAFDSNAPARDRRKSFEEFLSQVEEHLHASGLTLERGIPVSPVTDASMPLRYLLLWPHRRWLSWHHNRLLQAGEKSPVNHRSPLPSLRVAWWLRPAPGALVFVTAVLVLWVRWGTTAQWAPSAMAWLGLLMVAAVPGWNLFKEAILRSRHQDSLCPEMVIGQTHLPESLPTKLLPARACVVDLKKGRIDRPDGRHFMVKDLSAVEYGPSRGQGTPALDSGMAVRAWHMAVEKKDQRGHMHEVFHNASVDMVRHGDLDGGYAVFNWVLARELALAASGSLRLAQGRVTPGDLGKPLVEVLEKDLVRYDPDSMQEARAKMRATIHMASDADHLDVWGPLVRLPESCATPPLWKMLAIVLLLALIPKTLMVAGLWAGYLIAVSMHQWLTAQHFARPGFRLDAQGVWVRGECISWDELEMTSLMPVSTGSIVFAGRRTLLVAGHLGGSYAERAWLGCAVYQWIQQTRCEKVR